GEDRERSPRNAGGIACGADRYGVVRAHAGGKLHEPISLHTRLLAASAEMRLAQAPAVEDHLIAHFPFGMARGLDRARKVDAGDHWESPHDRRLTGDGEAVLVVER